MLPKRTWSRNLLLLVLLLLAASAEPQSPRDRGGEREVQCQKTRVPSGVQEGGREMRDRRCRGEYTQASPSQAAMDDDAAADFVPLPPDLSQMQPSPSSPFRCVVVVSAQLPPNSASECWNMLAGAQGRNRCPEGGTRGITGDGRGEGGRETYQAIRARAAESGALCVGLVLWAKKAQQLSPALGGCGLGSVV